MLCNSGSLIPQSHELLLRLASKVVHKFSTEDLASLSTDTMKEIMETLGEESKLSNANGSDYSCSTAGERGSKVRESSLFMACETVDRYLFGASLT